ncbi:hypothetical protein LTR84_002557 [Exophiala bonariae]|uniref:Xylanolytic transcriptional activator regulatory domain-containing protein n=1 Tax=Exophiala bonariae TaxID=1690606 RepID=A0AAV9N9S9_9EURO|nr:hypothetical protein LTR84_002557 [Exophiala bonariae]
MFRSILDRIVLVTRKDVPAVIVSASFENIPLQETEIAQLERAQASTLLGTDIWRDPSGANSYLFYNENAFDLNLDWIFNNNFDAESELAGQRELCPQAQNAEQSEPTTDTRGRNLLHGTDTLILPVPDTVERYDPDDALVEHAAPLTTFILPDLVTCGEVEDYSPFYLSQRFGNSTRALMESWIRLPLKQSMWDAISLQAFPSKERLDQCIDLYFAQFDQHCPVVHRPTFDPAREPAVTLAMVTLGACFTSFSGAPAFSNALSELVRRLLIFMPEQDPRFVRTEYYVTAQLLQTVHGFFCGNRRIFELAEASRTLLINHGRRMGLFNRRESSCPPHCSLEERWHAWIRDERFRLLGWAIYGSDATVGYMLNVKPQISLSETDMDLQISSKHWEAPSAHAWAALHPWTQTPKNVLFQPLLRSLFEKPETVLTILKDEHHIIPFILTLMRTLWAITELETNPIRDFFLRDDQGGQNRTTLLRILDRLAISPLSQSGLDDSSSRTRVAHRLQTIHMAHILSGGAFTQWLYPYLRGGSDFEAASDKKSRWAAEDPARVRDQAFRCAQIIRLIREYPFNAPQEAFNLYHAATLLWCLSDILSDGEPWHYYTEGASCRLDHLGHEESTESAIVKYWIKYGEARYVSLYGVPDLLSHDGRLQLLHQTSETLRTMQVWGIAQNFLRIVLRLAKKESQY